MGNFGQLWEGRTARRGFLRFNPSYDAFSIVLVEGKTKCVQVVGYVLVIVGKDIKVR